MIIFIVIALICCVTNPVLAKDFGKQGQIFEVKEEGFVTMVQRRLRDIDLKQHEKKMQALVRKRIAEPSAVPGITRSTKTNSHSFDPSYMVTEDIYLPCGKLLYQAGTTINPLDHMEWEGKIVFIDGRDKEQVAWARDSYIETIQQLKSGEEENKAKRDKDSKIVLTGGRHLELEKALGKPIYFDQFGELTTKFNIAHVPAIVEQDGKYLKVTEVNIGESK